MKIHHALATLACLVATPIRGQDVPAKPEFPEMPTPTAEHKWLERFVGEWESTSEAYMDPEGDPIEGKGSETVRSIGGFWIVAEGNGEMGEFTMRYVMSLGYDEEKERYVGTWIDSATPHMWTYEGKVDETGKRLTLEAEGPCPLEPGKTRKFRDITEFKGDDLRVFTSQMLGDEGEWFTMAKGEFRRKKE